MEVGADIDGPGQRIDVRLLVNLAMLFTGEQDGANMRFSAYCSAFQFP